MNKYLFFIFSLIISVNIQAEKRETIKFELDQLSVSEDNSQIFYSDFENAAFSGGISLPFQTILINNIYTDFNSDFSYTVLSKEQIGINQKSADREIPTSLDRELYNDVVSSVSFDQLGTVPVVQTEIVEIDGEQYLKLIVFPVTIDSVGELRLNSSLNIQVSGQELSPEQILSYNEIKNSARESKSSGLHQALSSSTQYLIISDSSLSSSFEALVQYKNETGIQTELVLIEDILPFYSGRDDAEKLREYLKEFYASGGEYLLLGGDETILPIRYTYHNIAYGEIDLGNQQINDLYFADLTGDWNFDNDAVWGEKYSDSVDLDPELKVGRLPFNSPVEVDNYIEKLIDYETNRNDLDLSYLEKVFFFSSDQMRDYEVVGQHRLIAESYPSNFEIDTTNGVELSSGDDPAPTNQTSQMLVPVLSEGYGIVNIIAHGSSSTFGVRTANYNEWPKSYFTTDTAITGHGIISDLAENSHVSFYASLGCDNGAFDKDQPPFNQMNPNMVQTLLARKQSGAVGFIANSRWGWVSSSHLLQKRFFEYLFANPNRPAVIAMYEMKDDYYFYRDLVYGINFFGDPTLIVYTEKPEQMDLTFDINSSKIFIENELNGSEVDDATVVISVDGVVTDSYQTDINGEAVIDFEFELGESYQVSAIKDGFTISQKEITPSIATDINDDNYMLLPDEYSLNQNYPNPFNPGTKISFSLPTGTNVKISVFNILGQEIRVLANYYYTAGEHTLKWDSKNSSGKESASGFYFYRLETVDFSETKKMVLIR